MEFEFAWNKQVSKQANVSEDSLFVLAWDIEGYYKLVEKNETNQITIRGILQKISGPPNEWGKIQADMANLKKKLSLTSRV